MDDTVAEIVERFELQPHPEGGYFREVYRSSVEIEHPGVPASAPRSRRAGSLIYFLLGGTDFSAFHRVRWTDEIWHLYAGGPIELHMLTSSGAHSVHTIAANLDLAAEPTLVVPAGTWQAARLAPSCPPDRAWAFGGCSVAPAFEFTDFEMPDRATLLEQYPQHADIIRMLTRG